MHLQPMGYILQLSEMEDITMAVTVRPRQSRARLALLCRPPHLRPPKPQVKPHPVLIRRISVSELNPYCLAAN